MGMSSSTEGIIGIIHATKKNHDTGEITETVYRNIVTNSLLGRIAQWMSGVNNTGYNPAKTPTKFEMGTGTGTVAKTDSSLFTPVSGSQIGVATRSASGNVSTITISYPQNYVTGTFTEGALLDDDGVILTHILLSPSLQIVANESVTLTYTLTIN